MEANPKSSKHSGHKRTNFCAETVGMGQLRWQEKCGKVSSPFVILGLTSFGDSWGEGQGTIAVGREVPVLQKE